jgi:hypothetical protein
MSFQDSQGNSGIVFGSIVNEAVIEAMLKDATDCGFCRSCVNPELGHCGELILRICKADPQKRRRIRMLFPSPGCPDLKIRAIEARQDPNEVVRKVADWLEALLKIRAAVAPLCDLQVHITDRPHRYAAIYTESQIIVAPAFYCEACLTTFNFMNKHDTTGMIAPFRHDFDELFRKDSRPYEHGDATRILRNPAQTPAMDEPLLQFKRRLPRVLDTLLFIHQRFAKEGDRGASKADIAAQFKKDESDSNELLREMECAGLLCRAGDRERQGKITGRIATDYGRNVLKRYRFHQI